MEKEKSGISLRNLVKCFGNFTAVDQVNLEISEGSFFSPRRLRMWQNNYPPYDSRL